MLLVPKENFATAEPDLVWGDNLFILIALQSSVIRNVIAALFTQADTDDLNDHTTEYGGILISSAPPTAASTQTSGAAAPPLRRHLLPAAPRPARRRQPLRRVQRSPQGRRDGSLPLPLPLPELLQLRLRRPRPR